MSEIRLALVVRGADVAARTVMNLMQRYEELVALHLVGCTRG